MQIVHAHHMALYTRNFARLRDFYTGVLGCPIVGAFPGHNIVFIDVGGTTIELTEDDGRGEDAGEPGWNHLALEVPDVDAAYAELSAQGIPFHIPPATFPEEAPSMRYAFFRDPDGNAIELIQPLGARYPHY